MPEITNSTTVDFTFTLDWEDNLGEGDFVEVKNASKKYIAQITQMETNRSSSIEANATLLGDFPKIPFQKGTEVERADKETVLKRLKLPEDGLYMGDIRSFNVPVHLDVQDTLEKHIGVFGRTDTGKSYTAAVVAEELLEHNQPLLIIDPHGEYASLKVSQDNTPSEYRVTQYADTDIVTDRECTELTSVSDYTEFIRPGQATVLNLKGYDEDWRREFVDDVLSTLYQERTRGNIEPAKVLVDEAHQFAGTKKSERCSSMRTIASEGRKFGFTFTLVSQRPARIDTNVRSQMQTLILHKLTDDTDVSKAIESAEGIDKTWKTPIQKLNQGECIMAGDLLKTPLFVSVRQRKTKHYASSGESFEVSDYTDTTAVEEQQEILEKQVSETEVKQLRSQVQTLQTKKKELQNQIEQIQTNNTDENHGTTQQNFEDEYNDLQNKVEELQSQNKELQEENQTLRTKLESIQVSTPEEEHQENKEEGSSEKSEDFGLNDPTFIYDTIDQIQTRITSLPEVQQKMLRWFKYNKRGRPAEAYANAGRSPNSSKKRKHTKELVTAGFLTVDKDGRKKYYEYALPELVEKQVGKAVEKEYISEIVARIETVL